MTQIKFGTSGWRGVLAEDFTLDNVRTVTQAIADYLHAEGVADNGLVVGHDSRLCSRVRTKITQHLKGYPFGIYFLKRSRK